MNVGQNIKRIREEQRYTQTEIARRCGVTPAAISGLEHGDFTPSTALLVKIARALEVEPGELLKESAPLGSAPVGEAEGPTVPSFPDVLEMDDEELNALRARAREDKSVFDALVAEHTAVQENVIRLREQGVPDEEMGATYQRHVILRKLWKVTFFERLHSVPAAAWPGRKPEAPTYEDTTSYSLDDAYAVWFNVPVPAGAR